MPADNLPYSEIKSKVEELFKVPGLTKHQLIQGFANILGPGLGSSRVCYNEKQGNVYTTVIEWLDEGVKPSIGQKLPGKIIQKLVTSDIHDFTREKVIQLLPREFKYIAGPFLSVLEILQNIVSIIAGPIYINGELCGFLSLDNCRDRKDQTNWSEEKLNFTSEIIKLLCVELDRRKLIAPIFTQSETALLILDMIESTNLVVDYGDDIFIEQIDRFHRTFMEHESSVDLQFLKNTGDGFLAVYRTMTHAFSVGWDFVEHGAVRIALHWGVIDSGVGGDPLGVEVHRIFRVEGVSKEDCVKPDKKDAYLPDSGRILATRPALQQLNRIQRSLFRPVGEYKLKGFTKPCELSRGDEVVTPGPVTETTSSSR